MTDEEVIEQALKTVREYAKQRKGDTFDINECVGFAVKAIEPIYRGVRFSGRILSPSQARELGIITERVKPELEKRARDMAHEYLKKRKADSINHAAYEAMITSELRARGYMYTFNWQKNKVGVTVRISDTLACTQEIKYSDIRRGLLPALIADVAEAVDLLSGRNLKVSIWEMSEDWKSWVKWIV